MLNLNHLHYFFVTVKEGSITNAAKRLSLTQPTLSNQLKTLENSIGEKLMARTRNGIELTARGQITYEYAKEIFGCYEELMQVLRYPSRNALSTTVSLTIGITYGLDSACVADVICELLKTKYSNSDLALCLIAGDEASLVTRLREGRIHVLVTGRGTLPEFDPIAESALPIYLAVPTLNPNTEKIQSEQTSRTLHAAALLELLQARNVSLVLPEAGSWLRRDTEDFLEKVGFKPRVMVEVDSVRTMVRLVENGVGMAFLPIPYMFQELKKGHLCSVGPDEGYWVYQMNIIKKKSSDRTPVMQDLVEVFKRVLDRRKHA